MGHNNEEYLAVFDVEGIILPKRRHLLLQAVEKLSYSKILTLLFYGALYEIRVFSLEQALRRIYQLFRDISRENFYQTLKMIPIIPGVKEVFVTLQEKGYQIALVSSGIPDFYVRELTQELSADYGYGLELEIVNDKLTGKIAGDVIKTKGKAVIVEKLMLEKGYSKHQCIAIGDDRNNLPMSSLCGKTIGYNPDTLMAIQCDYAIKGDLKDILPLLETPVKTSKAPYSLNDAYREIIHAGSMSIPLVCYFLNINKYMIVTIIVIVTVAYTISELARRMQINVPFFTTITNSAMIGEERWEFANSPIFFALGIILSLILFESNVGYASITILTLGDSTAKLIGKKRGKTILPYNKMKRLEGVLAGIITSTLVSSLFVHPIKALITSTISMIVESLPLPINDNIVIPIIAGLVLTALS